MARTRPTKSLPVTLPPQHNTNDITTNGNVTVLEPTSVSEKGVLPRISKSLQKTPLGCSARHQHTVLPQMGRIQQKTSHQHATPRGMQTSKALPTKSSDSTERQKTVMMPTFKRLAVSPETVLRESKSYLTEYELEEIKDYTQVWCLGEKAKKTQSSNVTETQKIFNSGYDTKEGYYNAAISDHLVYRFEILEVLGRGYSGQVLKCMDHKTGEQVAIKVIRNQDSVHRLGEAEVEILETLRKLDKNNKANIAHMMETFYFRNHLCITFELFEKDLCKALKENKQRGFNEGEVRKYAIDVLKCLRVLNKKKIVHGDLKPANMLLHKKDSGKRAAVGDFGGSYFEKDRDQPTVHTLNYESPENLLGKRCSPAIDMWSLGCSLAELHLGRCLFHGHDKAEQFNLIMKVLGVPPAELVVDAPKRNKFFDSDGIPLKMTYFIHSGATLAKHLKSKDADFVDFIRCCLEYDPVKRITPKEALQHPWIQQKRTKPVAIAGRTCLDAPVPSSSKAPALLKREKIPLVQLLPIKKTSAKQGGN